MSQCYKDRSYCVSAVTNTMPRCHNQRCERWISEQERADATAKDGVIIAWADYHAPFIGRKCPHFVGAYNDV